MADINELQQAINERRVNPKDLNEEQTYALDEAFRSGQLKGYTDFKEYSGLFDVAAKSLAITKQKELEPLKAATGIERGEVTTDGSDREAQAEFKFIPANDVVKAKDIFIPGLFLKLFKYVLGMNISNPSGEKDGLGKETGYKLSI